MKKLLTNTPLPMVGAYSLAHFAVDLCCALIMLPCARASEYPLLVLLIYNFCAFAMQLPIGAFADYFTLNRVMASAGCVMVSLGWALPMPWLVALVCGLGNAFFHVGGGIEVMSVDKKAKLLGVFVSPGAMGIFLGTLLSGRGDYSRFASLFAAITAALLLPFCFGAPIKRTEISGINLTGKEKLALLCLFTVVCLRSYGGIIMEFSWKIGTWAWIFAACVVLGKALGGFLADSIGSLKASILSLGLAGVLFLFSNIPACGVAAILLFNMSMPITLHAAANELGDHKGAAFGLLTLALFLGMLPIYAGASGTNIVYGLICAASIALLLPPLVKRNA